MITSTREIESDPQFVGEELWYSISAAAIQLFLKHICSTANLFFFLRVIKNQK